MESFNFTDAMIELCEDISSRLPPLAYVDMSRVAVGYAQARKRTTHGLYASLTPLRFERGELTSEIDGQLYTTQRVWSDEGDEMLYILTFYLPRFMQLSFSEKLITIFHELLHINPNFDGDLRRFGGRCYVHTESEAQFDAWAAELAEKYLLRNPPPELYQFLRLNFNQLVKQHGGVVGAKIPQPKLIPVPDLLVE